MSQVEEADVTTGINELAAAVSGLGDLAKSTPKRRSEPKAKADPKKRRRKAQGLSLFGECAGHGFNDMSTFDAKKMIPNPNYSYCR